LWFEDMTVAVDLPTSMIALDASHTLL
jgi:hypothetical protein